MVKESGNVERRKYKRFPVLGGVYTVNTSRPGLIVDVSMAGLAVRYVERRKMQAESSSLDIVVEDTDFSLQAVPYRVVSQQRINSGSTDRSMMVKRMGLCFCDLTPQQISQLEYFIRNFSSRRQVGI